MSLGHNDLQTKVALSDKSFKFNIQGSDPPYLAVSPEVSE